MTSPNLTLGDIYHLLLETFPEAELVGDAATPIKNFAPIESATNGDLTFVANTKYEKYLSRTNASAAIVSCNLNVAGKAPKLALVRVEDAYTAFALVLERFKPMRNMLADGVHPTAIIAKSATIHPSARIGAYCYIGAEVEIGAETSIYPHTTILDGTKIGERCILYPNVVIYHDCQIGHRVTIHSGAVIGADGFGFAPQKNGTFKKIPQVGTVVLEDDVEIGANTCIDRATLGETRIKAGAKIDNLVQIGHNCSVGTNTVIASQAGLSGSTKIGNSCMIGGQVGFVGHLEIADRVTLGGQAGVTKSITKPGEFWRGAPAKPLREQLRQEAMIGKLEEMMRRLIAVEKELLELKAKKNELP
ncbi:MAG: UDP-3-O-(3-hydroxymyristoyl)glucosamine N-acyltransferase [Chloroherpetonaceae bacterium]|nr:UDP-3-O-(3-hydroxymyristoyl)glucosamine N-acyltransferase [Chloroherpetonaceae bacterium]MCS7211878.1 UDP-3-O-(3-hydroxymyristoyl)glucosamine N-acyltransferase [Chloroherpetonaceae bacterium]MDW8018609.1 UDP-3-O-(3-hydroxymyristoyl)glucosamine N-acyltransferase [Chloroherpetonaceae bacterium]MDW8466134.1 UDP-3-O-(3-hydroxymyristoyl)glucosamine N-acyltransferase [Chloroherpetonaceae bacterium]